VDDLEGTASERLARLEERRGRADLDVAWLTRQLMLTLRELADTQPAADAEREGREDY
jgi:hypothetical protein